MNFIAYCQWEQLPENANTLFAECEQDSLFNSRIWLENITTHALPEHYSLLLACVVEDKSVLAILPMMECPQGSLSSLSSRFTTLYSLLITNDCQQNEVMDCLAKGLLQLPVHPILFEPIDPTDANMSRLRQSLESCGFESHTYFRFYNWLHKLNGQSFDRYINQRPANLRNTIKRKQRKLEREHTHTIKLYKDADIGQALADYTVVYKASWKANEFFSDFTPALVKKLSRLGWVRLAVLYTNAQPIATQIWFVVHRKANIYRLVYDEKWKSYSPGSILTNFLMRYVVNTDKVSEIDFLTGNEQYKQDWMTMRKERLGIRLAKQNQQKHRISRVTESMKNLLIYKKRRYI